MQRLMLPMFLVACVLGMAGCSGEGDKGIVAHKEKPVHPAPDNAAKK